MTPDISTFASAAGVTVEAKLGENQYRRVFRVRRDGETYALKIATEHNNPDVHDLFRREAAALARVRHPLLPTAWTRGTVEDWPYLVTDLIPGRALSEWLNSGALTPERSVRLTLDLLRGLGALHAHGYLHGDLTPDSVIWDQREARIADFGRTTHRRHLALNRIGGPTYMAPEQTSMLNRLVDERSDLFTVGTILYECLTGEPAHPADNADDLVSQISRSSLVLPDETRHTISSELHDLLDRLVRTEPDERPSGARAAIEELADTPEARQTSGDQHADDTVVPQFTMPSGSERLAQARRLERGWQTVYRSGRGLLSVIEGEEGIGKSNLIDTLIQNVTPAPSKIARVRCSVTASSPLEPIHALVRSITDESPSTRAPSWPDRLNADDSSDQHLGDIQSETLTLGADSSSSESDPANLADQLTDAAAASDGVMIIVEQLERADTNTIGVLRRIAMALPKAPIHLIVGSTSNEGTPSASQRIWESAGSSHHETGAADDTARQHIRLATLDYDGTAAYLEDFLGRPLADESIAEAVYRTSDGNPLLTAEYANILLSSSAIRPDWDGWVADTHNIESIELDADASSLLKQRLHDLDDPVLEVLELAALWGDAMPVSLAAAAAQVPRDEVRTRLDAATAHGVLTREDASSEDPPDDSPRYRFRTPAYQRILEHELGDARRRQLHQRLGEAGADTGSSNFAVALHLARGTDASPRQTFRYCLRAGWQAHQSHAYETAITLLQAARSSCEQLERHPPAELLYLLGHSHIECEQLDCGRELIEEAIRRADNDVDRARYQTALNESLVTGFQLEKLEDGVRKCLDWAGRPVPTNRVTLIWALFIRMVTYAMWRIVGAPEANDQLERQRHQLLTRAYHHLSIAATGMSSTLLTLYSQFARLIAAMPLGPSYELVIAESSFGYVLGIIGYESRGRELLDRAADTAEHADTKRARVRVAAMKGLFATVAGDPVDSQRRLTRVLEEDGDHLQFSDRILVVQDLLWNLAARGHSREILRWFHWWEDRVELEAVSSDNPRASMLFSMTMWHARLLGRDDLADTLRDKSARVADPSSWMAAKLANKTALARDDLLRQDYDAVRHHLDALEDAPKEGILWVRAAEMTVAIGRIRLYEQTGADADLNAYRRAVDELSDIQDIHPILRCHTSFHRARLALTDDAPDSQIGRHIETTERLARRTDDRWIGMELARTRALWLDESDTPADSRDFARLAAQRAHRAGWRRQAERIRAEFDLDDSSLTPQSDDPDSANHPNISHVETHRRLDALVEASLATHDPAESDLRQTILKAALRALGAARGAVIERESGADDAHLAITRSVVDSGDEDDAIDRDSLDWSTIRDVVRSGEPRLKQIDDAEGAHASVLVVPLEAETHLQGALYLDNRRARGFFDDTDADIAHAIAHQLAAAIAKQHSTRLEVQVETEREQREYAERLQAFFRDVSTSLDLFDISERLVRELVDFLDAHKGYVVSLLRDEPTTTAMTQDGHTRAGPFDADDAHHGTPEMWRRLAERLDRDGATWIEQTAADESLNPFDDSDDDEPAGCWLAIPMRANQQMIGFVVVGHPDTHTFSTTEAQQAQTFVAQAAIAIDRVQLATFDDLTGLHNRRKFFEYAREHWQVAQTAPQPLSVLLLDIDDFKTVNDSHGHAVGDRVLADVADACRNSVRESDIVGRYGGEELAVLLPGTPLSAAADTVGERIRQTIHALTFDLDDGDSFGVSVSVGAAEKLECDSSIDDLLDRADSALYAAKSAGKNRVRVEPAEV